MRTPEGIVLYDGPTELYTIWLLRHIARSPEGYWRRVPLVPRVSADATLPDGESDRIAIKQFLTPTIPFRERLEGGKGRRG